MIFDKLKRGIFKPLRKVFTGTFASRGDIRRLEQRLAETEKLAGTFASRDDIRRLEQRLAETEKSAALTLQALHDLTSVVFGGPEVGVTKGYSRVGVVIPTCERPDHLVRALRSLTAQSRRPDQVVVVNDGRDPVQEIIEAFRDDLPLRVLQSGRPHGGSSAARNLALDILDTDFVTFVDDDNLMWPRWIERAAASLEADPKIDLVYGAQLRDSELSTTSKSWFLQPFDFDALKRFNFIDINQVMHRVSPVRFNPALRRLVDWDYVLRFIGETPARVRPIDAISSIYLTSAFPRVSVTHWPPDLEHLIIARDGSPEHPGATEPMTCSCCTFTGVFGPGPDGRADACCPSCGSLEDHRFLRLMGPVLRLNWVPATRTATQAVLVDLTPSPATASLRSLFAEAIMVGMAADTGSPPANFVGAPSAQSLPANHADVVLALDLGDHAAETGTALTEIVRVLAPTGIAILGGPSSDGRPATHADPSDRDFFGHLAEAGLTAASVSPGRTMIPRSLRKYGLRSDRTLVLVVRSDWPGARARLSRFVASLEQGGETFVAAEG